MTVVVAVRAVWTGTATVVAVAAGWMATAMAAAEQVVAVERATLVAAEATVVVGVTVESVAHQNQEFGPRPSPRRRSPTFFLRAATGGHMM